MRRVLSIVALAVVSSVGQVGFSAEPQGAAAGTGSQAGGAGGQVTAEDLFQQGVALIEKGKWAEAAAKLEESNRLDRAAGTTINLADCYEHIGKLASAWTLFVEAGTVFGQRTPPDARAATAKSRAEALYPRLSRLTIEVPDGVRATAGLVVKRDGEVVGGPQFGTGIAVDPGVHVVEASAPGKKAWKGEVKVEGEAARVAVSVPALADLPAEEKAKDKEAGWPWQKKVAVGAAGVGVAGVVVGAILGADALGKHGELAKECSAGDPGVCTAKGLSLAEGEKTSATVSTIGFAAGGVLVAAGVVLWIVAPSGGDGAGAGAGKGLAAKGKSGPRVWVMPQIGERTGVSAGVVW